MRGLRSQQAGRRRLERLSAELRGFELGDDLSGHRVAERRQLAEGRLDPSVRRVIAGERLGGRGERGQPERADRRVDLLVRRGDELEQERGARLPQRRRLRLRVDVAHERDAVVRVVVRQKMRMAKLRGSRSRTTA
ncbi:MAG TPA: hypothetical protein VE987_03260 [Polyangiaceae bacterium]|nr:hypothetical protein [Polyangiaceae bacterium]